MYCDLLTKLVTKLLVTYVQGCTKGQKSGGAGSNAARRRCPAAPSDLPKSGGAAAPPAPPLGASLMLELGTIR